MLHVDQAHDANALLLGNARDVVVTSLPVEEVYMSTYGEQRYDIYQPCHSALPVCKLRNIHLSHIHTLQSIGATL